VRKRKAGQKERKKEEGRGGGLCCIIIIHFNYTAGERLTVVAMTITCPRAGNEIPQLHRNSIPGEWAKLDRINHENCICESSFVCRSIKIHAAAPMRADAQLRNLTKAIRSNGEADALADRRAADRYFMRYRIPGA